MGGAASKESARNSRAPSSIGMDTVCCKQVCRRPIATVPIWRPPSLAAAVAFYLGWNEGAFGRIPSTPARGVPGIPETTDLPRARRRLGTRLDPHPLPPTGPRRHYSAQTSQDAGTSSAVSSELAAAAFVPSGSDAGQSRPPLPSSPRDDVAGSPPPESGVEATHARVRPPAVTTPSHRRLAQLSLIEAGTSRLHASLLSSHRALELVSAYAWSDRTLQARNSQWAAWVTFCHSENRSMLPVTEGHMASLMTHLQYFPSAFCLSSSSFDKMAFITSFDVK